PPGSSLTLVVAWAINEQGMIAGTGVPIGCAPADVEACGHAFLLIPNGDCDGDCQRRIDQSQSQVELRRESPSATLQAIERPLTPIERAHTLMRQRFGASGSRPTLRD